MKKFVVQLLSPNEIKCVLQTGYFSFVHNSTMAMGLTQPLTEISTRNISWG